MMTTYRLIQTFVVNDKFLILLPSCDKVIRYRMEHLAIDLCLKQGSALVLRCVA